MILSDTRIVERMNSGQELIFPFNSDALQSESYDLSMGKSISRLSQDFDILDLRIQRSIDALYRKEILGERGVLIGPREFILVSTFEKISLPNDLTAHIRPRTRFTRIGLLIGSQHCNSTYSGVLSLGLYNANAFAVRLTPGIRIAQVVFEEIGGSPSPERQYDQRDDSIFQDETGDKGSDFTTETFINSLSESFREDAESFEAYERFRNILNLGKTE